MKPNKKKQIGGVDVIRATLNMVRSMDYLRVSLNDEINALRNFSGDFNNASQPAVGVPHQLDGPPK